MRLREVLGGVLADLGLSRRLEEFQAVARWADSVGPEMARRARPVKVERGILLVEVDSSAWMAELGLLKPAILRRLNPAGRGPVREIHFRLAGRGR